MSPDYSVVYRQFLDLNLGDRPAIRGQLEGPISFGFNVLDEGERPILFNDTVRPFMLEFMARRINVQLQKLKERNAKAFMFVDEPWMQFLFSALEGDGELSKPRVSARECMARASGKRHRFRSFVVAQPPVARNLLSG